MKMTILFPVLNERLRLKKGIDKTITYMRSHTHIPYHILILDNGSTDETPQIAESLCRKYGEVTYVRVEDKGVGLAFRKGVELSEDDIVGYMDIDLSADITHLGEVIRIFENDPRTDYINGSRFHPDSRTQGRKWYRKITSKGLIVMLRIFFGMQATDAICGFTFMRRQTAKSLVAASGDDPGWFYMIELLLRAERMGAAVLDMPVEWIEDYDTTVNVWKTIRNYVIQMSRLKKAFRKEGKENAEKN